MDIDPAWIMGALVCAEVNRVAGKPARYWVALAVLMLVIDAIF